MSELPIRRALLSVSDKTGLVEFATGLCELGVEIVSTGGTAQLLKEAGLPIVGIGEFTGFPEMLDGRVKTLHPRVHAGILYQRENEAHVQTTRTEGIAPIDLVVVNLYPFESTVSQPGVTYEEAVEQIDIGGPSMTRSAAKNHADVTVVVSPSQYDEVLNEMRSMEGRTSLALRKRFALEAFRRTAEYDRAIADYFTEPADGDGAEGTSALPKRISVSYTQARELRYGENPHQHAVLYGDLLSRFRQLHGKELSYNNILDLLTAQEMAEDLGKAGPAVAIIKHSNPCGAAVGPTLDTAWMHALATDPASASGGIIGCSIEVDEAAAEAMKDHFIEVLIAPSFSPGALEILMAKKNRVLLECPRPLFDGTSLQLRSVPGGILAQTEDRSAEQAEEMRVVTQREPTFEEMEGLQFAWRVARFVKSNAIVFTGRDRTLGVGAGQMSRVDAAHLAVRKAKDAQLDLGSSVVASDAFFPFADGLIACLEAGASAVIQPGGSVRDKEVITAADDRDVAMVCTGARHFRH